MTKIMAFNHTLSKQLCSDIRSLNDDIPAKSASFHVAVQEELCSEMMYLMCVLSGAVESLAAMKSKMNKIEGGEPDDVVSQEVGNESDATMSDDTMVGDTAAGDVLTSQNKAASCTVSEDSASM